MTILEGSVERINFVNGENGYTVAKLQPVSGDSITIVGLLPHLYVGEQLRLKGSWVRHKEYGKQFQVEERESEIPQTVQGIERFLASGLIKGVGAATAKKLVSHFALDTLEVIENHPEKLAEIPGISSTKAERISENLKVHQEIQQIMVFLQGIGLGPGYALKIYKAYQQDAVAAVTENPYRLADQIIGIGFKTADHIARNLGIAADSPYRVRAGLRFLLNEYSGQGHVFVLEQDLLQVAVNELNAPLPGIAAELEELVITKEVFRDALDEQSIIYLAPYYYSEVGVVTRLKNLAVSQLKPLTIDVEQALERFSAENQIVLAEKQRQAVLAALQNGVMVITGGPGTGKTTIIKAILYLFRQVRLRALLAAPTGRAAKRLAETTGESAQTIHRCLGFGGESSEGRFHHGVEDPLAAEVIIIDEFSMVDLMLFYHLLKAVAGGTRLIMVGDMDQLPSVGPGSVLRDLIASTQISAVRLDVIFRQAQTSLIIENAHRINRGEFPLFSKGKDFFFIPEEQPEQLVKILPDLVKRRIPGYLSCDPVEEIQVLAPMRRTMTGVENLNRLLQEALNPAETDKGQLQVGNTFYRMGDKVMQIRNNYQKSVFNGDIGRIRAIDPEDRRMVIGFQEVEGERLVEYEEEEWEQLVLSYAISVHKSQGNEYPVVVMPITTQHFLMLQRNLLYTAVTRAKKMVVLIGTKKAIAIAVRNNRIQARNSLLSQRLQRAFEEC